MISCAASVKNTCLVICSDSYILRYIKFLGNGIP